ncbi:cobalamin biosynthesis protein [Streptomyces sp. NPDC051907]|uniref:cobalamin biosynthesis protein n=1 Tax=Streptomyces sp. NPDC051907 TaxID=3155284 RepID=UPI003435DC55
MSAVPCDQPYDKPDPVPYDQPYDTPDPVPGRALLVVGVGASTGVGLDEVLGLVESVLREAGPDAGRVVELATVEGKAHEPGIAGAAERLGVPLATYPAERLARVRVPNPSGAPLAAHGTPSVAEAAALAGGGELLVPKRKSAPEGRPAMATCALVRRGRPAAPPARPRESARPSGRGGVDPATVDMMTVVAVGSAAAASPPDVSLRHPPHLGVRVTSPPALLIAEHGGRDGAGADGFWDFVREVGRRHPGLPVVGGYVDPPPRSPSPPSPSQSLSPSASAPSSASLGDAVAELVERGVERFAAVPLTLAPSQRAESAVPAALTREVERRPELSYACGRPLGPHPALLSVLARRLDEALGAASRRPGDRAEVTVLLVGRGGDADANAEAARAARLLWEGRGYAGVETAFASLAAPDVPSGLDRCVRLGARRIVVLPYLLFADALVERVRQQAQGWAAAHPEAEVVQAEVIGPAEELLDLVMERYHEALAGERPDGEDIRTHRPLDGSHVHAH